jgi:hypothetical protein
VQRDTSPPSAPLAFFTFMMLLAPVSNWEPHGVTLTGYCYAMRHRMKVQIVTPYRVSHLQCYGVTVRGNVISVYPPLDASRTCYGSMRVSMVQCEFLTRQEAGHSSPHGAVRPRLAFTDIIVRDWGVLFLHQN